MSSDRVNSCMFCRHYLGVHGRTNGESEKNVVHKRDGQMRIQM